jgi:endogenous inhibitor of DNA gyrase (YacG/DUF329 family)
MTQGMTRCPLCGKPVAEKFKPFCSPRCSTLDLGKWLGEHYKFEECVNAEEVESLPNAGEDEKQE